MERILAVKGYSPGQQQRLSETNSNQQSRNNQRLYSVKTAQHPRTFNIPQSLSKGRYLQQIPNRVNNLKVKIDEVMNNHADEAQTLQYPSTGNINSPQAVLMFTPSQQNANINIFSSHHKFYDQSQRSNLFDPSLRDTSNRDLDDDPSYPRLQSVGDKQTISDHYSRNPLVTVVGNQFIFKPNEQRTVIYSSQQQQQKKRMHSSKKLIASSSRNIESDDQSTAAYMPQQTVSSTKRGRRVVGMGSMQLKNLLGYNQSVNDYQSRNQVVASNISNSFIKSTYTSNRKNYSEQNQQSSNLMKILNLKQLQSNGPHSQQNKTHSQSISLDSQNQYQGIINETSAEQMNDSSTLNQSMQKFFQKKDAHKISQKPSVQLNNLQPIEAYSVNKSRKDYQGEQNQSFLRDKLGIENQYYLIGQPKLFGIRAKSSYAQKAKRDPKFEDVYKSKLKELRKQQDEVMSSESPKRQKTPEYLQTNQNRQNNLDISLYKERNDNYKILSNRIKTRALLNERRYVDKSNIRILEKFFDPLRIRLRVMPIKMAPLTQGKNSDFYFIEAGKLSLKGELTKAIELLKRGLELKPNHYLCRFNHGVLLFKLGLIIEAQNDFEQLVKENPNDVITAYNLAICLVQTGNYQEALVKCQIVLCHEKQDKSLLFDIFKLKGICHFRLGQVKESTRCYNQANKLKTETINHNPEYTTALNSIDQLYENKKQQRKDLEYTYINLFIEETKHVFEDPKFKQQVLKGSKSVPSLNFVLKDLCTFTRINSQRSINQELPIKKKSILKKPNALPKTPQPYKNSKISLMPQKIGPNILLQTYETEKDKQLTQQQKLEEQYYQELKMQQRSIIDQGNKGVEQNSIINSQDLNAQEQEVIEKRKRIEAEIMQQTLENDESHLQNQAILDNLLTQGKKIQLALKEVAGTQSDTCLSQVLQEQSNLLAMLHRLSQRFSLRQLDWDRDFARELSKFSKDVLMRGDDDYTDDDEEQQPTTKSQQRLIRRRRLANKESIIAKLNESLRDENITPDDVQNILMRDKAEKQRNEMIKQYRNQKSIKRLSLQQIEFIKEEFNKSLDIPRDVKMLDRVIKQLKFFKRFNQETRAKIYREAELLSLPGHQIIFNQGDIGDKLYVILKGRVAVQINSVEYGRLPVVVATLSDGDQFGELSLISLNKVQDFSNKQGEVFQLDKGKEEFQRRKATCLTVEQCDLLVLSKDLSVHLYQPDVKPPTDNLQSYQTFLNSDEAQDQLNQKIAFLQSIPLFHEIDAQFLMPVACNLQPQYFSFGEYILKEGEIPKGLYIIKSGQCKVACTRIADREYRGNYDLNKKLKEKKNKSRGCHELFEGYDAENSLLNEVKTMNRGFQNDRIYVDEKGEQIRDKIVYQDILTFTQLMPRNFFGGRVLLPFEMYMNLRRIFFGEESLKRTYPKSITQSFQDSEPEESYQLKSLLSVIADSGVVEVYILDKMDMSYIPDYVLKRVYESIAQEKEPDRPCSWTEVEEIKERMVKWERFKVKCVRELFIRKMQENKQAKCR